MANTFQKITNIFSPSQNSVNPGQNAGGHDAGGHNAGQNCTGGQIAGRFWGRVDRMPVSKKNFLFSSVS